MNQTLPESTTASGLARRPRAPRWVGAVAIVVLIAGWFGYLRWVSGVLVHEEKHPNGKVKVAGFLKRTGWNDYKRHGVWTSYHADGRMASQGRYEMGQRLDDWKYWDERGEPTTAPASADLDN